MLVNYFQRLKFENGIKAKDDLKAKDDDHARTERKIQTIHAQRT